VIISGRVFENTAESLAGSMPGEEICQIMVRDNGIGFDEQYVDRIFQVFQRLHSRSEYEGTGIGLAVCRKIADRHGGTISAKSAEGEGATFIVTMPVKQRMSEPNEEAR
jgi:light-regulated signal transduction histidine kinase (bacteriophytochrome)